jgi:hypothetical protein
MEKFAECDNHALRACANRWASFCTWQLLEGSYQPSDYRLSHTLLAYWRGLLVE